MWIPTPSMTLPQRAVLYGTCAVALLNSVGLVVLLVQQNQLWSRLEQTELRLTGVEQSSVVEFLQEVPRGAAMQASPMDQYQYQYSRNKRSQGLEKEKQKELKELSLEEGQELLQEPSQEVGEEMGKKMKHELKQKHRHSQSHHKMEVQEDMMMMMTYSMVPVRCLLNGELEEECVCVCVRVPVYARPLVCVQVYAHVYCKCEEVSRKRKLVGMQIGICMYACVGECRHIANAVGLEIFLH